MAGLQKKKEDEKYSYRFNNAWQKYRSKRTTRIYLVFTASNITGYLTYSQYHGEIILVNRSPALFSATLRRTRSYLTHYPLMATMELLNLCLISTYFQYNGKHYKQLHGTAMGSPVSVVVTEIVMQNIEEQALATYARTILLWLP